MNTFGLARGVNTFGLMTPLGSEYLEGEREILRVGVTLFRSRHLTIGF